jgi:hypothetical protein
LNAQQTHACLPAKLATSSSRVHYQPAAAACCIDLAANAYDWCEQATAHSCARTYCTMLEACQSLPIHSMVPLSFWKLHACIACMQLATPPPLVKTQSKTPYPSHSNPLPQTHTTFRMQRIRRSATTHMFLRCNERPTNDRLPATVIACNQIPTHSHSTVSKVAPDIRSSAVLCSAIPHNSTYTHSHSRTMLYIKLMLASPAPWCKHCIAYTQHQSLSAYHQQSLTSI